MSKTRLGIDIGTNSLGWFLYSLRDAKDGSGKTVTEIDGVVDAGVRIFASGRDPQSYASLNEDRRAARMMRRQRDRYLQRRDGLMRYLVRYGLMPQNRAERKRLEKLNPYELRAWAITGGESPYPEFEPQHLVGRAIFHLNQRRGFKSNRITDKGKDDGPVNDSVKQFRAQLGDKTVGQFLWEIRKGKSIRARREGTKKTDLYDYYADRAMIESEFDDIWKKQADIRPQIFGGEIGRERGKIVREIIFRQRPLKPPIIGKCRYLRDEYRAPRALPSFQRFRILKEVNNLRYYDIGGEENRLPDEARTEIIDKLTSQQSMTFGAMKKILRRLDKRVHEFNFEDGNRKGFEGDETNAVIGKVIGERWDAMSLPERDELVTLLLSDKNETDAAITLTQKWQMNKKQARDCVDKSVHLPSGYGNLSRRAIDKMLPHLEEGIGEYEASKAADIFHESCDESVLLNKLSPYTEVLRDHCLPRKIDDEDDKRIPNPTVHIALNQFRWVVNDLILRFGKPSEFVVELARDLPHGKIQRDKEMTKQRKSAKDNKDRRELLKEEGLPATPDNMLRLRLWEELGDLNNRRCIFCGNVQFGVRRLFSHETHIEHILPRSRTLDDSPLNKTLSCGNCNRDKGNLSPNEKWESDEERYAGILSRAKNLPEKKRVRFQRGAIERFLNERDFLERQLVETRYIGRLARRYLEEIVPNENIWVIPGRLTKLLRDSWGLNTILAEKDALRELHEAQEILQNETAPPEERKRAAHKEHEAMRRIGRKNRSDHRHHAVDAAIIGATTRAVLKKFADAAGKAEEAQIEKMPAPGEPMPGFLNAIAEAINGIIVSHKPQRHRERKLHKDTAYGIVNDADKKEGIYKRTVVHQGVVKNLTVIPIADRAGNYYKAYEGKKNWAYEFFYAGEGKWTKEKKKIAAKRAYAIFYSDGGNWSEGKWGAELISTFDANRKKTAVAKDGGKVEYCSFVPEWRQDNPTAQLIMRIHMNDLFALEENDERRIYRVQKLANGKITLAPHFQAKTDERNPDRSPDTLRQCNARKIHVSPAGRVYDPGPPHSKKTE